MAIINTEQELIEKLDKEGIHRDWYSFDGNMDKPVSFDGEYVYYHGLKRKVESGEHYYFMFYELAEYKRLYEFYNSDSIMYVSNIKILITDGGHLKKVCAPGKYEMWQYSMDKDDPKVLECGYKFEMYWQYDGIYCYRKYADASIFQEMEIHFGKKTTIEEIYFSEEQLLKDELSKLDEYQNILSSALQKEVLRQKQASNKDREALLEVYRSIVRGYEKETFGVVAGESRTYRLANKCLDEAGEKLGVGKED